MFDFFVRVLFLSSFEWYGSFSLTKKAVLLVYQLAF